MVFKNQKQLEGFLMKKCQEAVAGTEQKVHDIIDRCLQQFYNEFDPDEYIRTGQLLHSLVKSGVKKVGNGYEAEVYFNVDGIHYQNGQIEIQSTASTGRMGYAAWDKDTILDVVMTGSYSGLPHGGRAGGTAIWTKSQATINALGGVIEMLERELRLIGVPIVKG
jgi:hypothetical protein